MNEQEQGKWTFDGECLYDENGDMAAYMYCNARKSYLETQATADRILRAVNSQQPEIECPKCKKVMQTTPVCCECGTIPIAEPSFRKKDEIIRHLIHACKNAQLWLNADAWRNGNEEQKQAWNKQRLALDQALALAEGK